MAPGLKGHAATGPVPTGDWGLPARLRRTPEAIDLRETSAFPSVTRPRYLVPPPPAPPARTAKDRPSGRSQRRRAQDLIGRYSPLRLRALAELLIGAVILGVLVLAVRPQSPESLSAQAIWAQQTATSTDRLASDLTSASTAVPLSPATITRLRADADHLRRHGPPPDPRLKPTWDRVLAAVQEAVSEGSSAPAQARSDLALASLELVALSGAPG